MKVRQSFVSNSSSCSFVIGKIYLTEEQIEQLNEKFGDMEDLWGETYVCEHKLYFFGKLSYADSDDIVKFFKENGIDKNVLAIEG